MRIRLAFIAALSIAANALGQGRIGFWNIGASPEQKVYIDEWLNPSALAPGGAQFLVALYFGPPGADESALTQLGGTGGFSFPGVFFGGTRTVPDYVGVFQVKGWEAAFGSTYEEAKANPAARVGQSPVFTAYASFPTEPAYSLIEHSQGEFRGFVIAVPEPSSGMLLFAGIVTSALVFRRKLFGRE